METVVLLKAHVSLQLWKIFSSDNKVSVYNIFSYMYSLLHKHTAKTDMFIYRNMYECFMNTRYLCACLKEISCNFEP